MCYSPISHPRNFCFIYAINAALTVVPRIIPRFLSNRSFTLCRRPLLTPIREALCPPLSGGTTISHILQMLRSHSLIILMSEVECRLNNPNVSSELQRYCRSLGISDCIHTREARENIPAEILSTLPSDSVLLSSCVLAGRRVCPLYPRSPSNAFDDSFVTFYRLNRRLFGQVQTVFSTPDGVFLNILVLSLDGTPFVRLRERLVAEEEDGDTLHQGLQALSILEDCPFCRVGKVSADSTLVTFPLRGVLGSAMFFHIPGCDYGVAVSHAFRPLSK